MADNYTNNDHPSIYVGDANLKQYPVKSSYEIHAYALVGIDGSGNAQPHNRSYAFGGIADGFVTNSDGGSNRSAFVNCFTGLGKEKVFGPYTITHSTTFTWSHGLQSGGMTVYAYNSSMVCTNQIDSSIPIGRVYSVPEDDKVYVTLMPSYYTNTSVKL